MSDPGPATDVAVGDVLGPYRLEDMLGQGAAGVVFLAIRADDSAEVAVKVLRAALARDGTYRKRFLREVRVASDVQSPHLLPILDSGELDGRAYLVTPYVACGTLADRIGREGFLPLAECVSIVSDAGAGLDALHRGGLVHRDVKPSNIMLDDAGRAALTDFGLAHGDAYTVLTRPGEPLGTPDYIAPELLRGESAEGASDIYSLGCVLYECLTGAPPFAGRRILELSVAHLEEVPSDPRDVRPDMPEALSWAVLKALAKSPEERPRTARAFASMLRVALPSSR